MPDMSCNFTDNFSDVIAGDRLEEDFTSSRLTECSSPLTECSDSLVLTCCSECNGWKKGRSTGDSDSGVAEDVPVSPEESQFGLAESSVGPQLRIPRGRRSSSSSSSESCTAYDTPQTPETSVAPCPSAIPKVNSISRHCEEIRSLPYYFGPVSASMAHKLLRNCKEGTFIIRDSSSAGSLFTLSFRTQLGTQHIRLKFPGNEIMLDSVSPVSHRSTTVAGLVSNLKRDTASRKCFLRVKDNFVRLRVIESLNK